MSPSAIVDEVNARLCAHPSGLHAKLLGPERRDDCLVYRAIVYTDSGETVCVFVTVAEQATDRMIEPLFRAAFMQCERDILRILK